jgi:hypothetical protein
MHEGFVPSPAMVWEINRPGKECEAIKLCGQMRLAKKFRPPSAPLHADAQAV